MQMSVSLPFQDFKWRWMEVTPIESLNRPDIYTGVTRALMHCEGASASSDQFNDLMQSLQNDLLVGSKLTVAANDQSRNLIRRQGRYWKGMDVLKESAPSIELTAKGRALASGELTAFEFALQMIISHELPNRSIDALDVIARWDAAKLRIKPLLLVCEILLFMFRTKPDDAYITPEELVKVVIPLSTQVNTLSIANFVDAIALYRTKSSSIFLTFPDCVPSANDKRMAREHLLFLQYFSVLGVTDQVSQGNWGDTERFFLSGVGLRAVNQFIKSDGNLVPQDALKPVATTASGQMPSLDLTVIRSRRIVEMLSRPGQSRFRKLVLSNCGKKCVLTGVSIGEVLQACHIIPVSSGGSDQVQNGISLRSDLHTLFDCGKLRINELGVVELSPDLIADPTYGILPKTANLPDNVSKEALRRRFNYGSEFAEV